MLIKKWTVKNRCVSKMILNTDFGQYKKAVWSHHFHSLTSGSVTKTNPNTVLLVSKTYCSGLSFSGKMTRLLPQNRSRCCNSLRNMVALICGVYDRRKPSTSTMTTEQSSDLSFIKTRVRTVIDAQYILFYCVYVIKQGGKLTHCCNSRLRTACTLCDRLVLIGYWIVYRRLKGW